MKMLALDRWRAIRFADRKRKLVPIFLSVDHNRKQFHSIAIGPINYDDIKEHLQAKQSLQGFSYAEFLDARSATISWNLNEITQIVQLIRTLHQEMKPGPIAVLVSSDLSFGMVSILEATLEDAADIRPFRNEEEARAWLASR